MRVLFDTNVVLDVVLKRHPFSGVAARLIGRVERKEWEGALCATTLTTIFYVAEKAVGTKVARETVRDLLTLFQVAKVDRSVLETAVALPLDDFEDAVLLEAGRAIGIDALVTRNAGDFGEAALLVLSPEELEASLTVLEDDA